MNLINDELLHEMGDRFVANNIGALTGATFEEYLIFPASLDAMAAFAKGMNFKKGDSTQWQQNAE